MSNRTMERTLSQRRETGNDEDQKKGVSLRACPTLETGFKSNIKLVNLIVLNFYKKL